MNLAAMIQEALNQMPNSGRGGGSIQELGARVEAIMQEHGYRITSIVEDGMSPLASAAVDLAHFKSCLEEQGFSEDEAFSLVEIAFDAKMNESRPVVKG